MHDRSDGWTPEAKYCPTSASVKLTSALGTGKALPCSADAAARSHAVDAPIDLPTEDAASQDRGFDDVAASGVRLTRAAPPAWTADGLRTAAETAVWYARVLGWPVTPGAVRAMGSVSPTLQAGPWLWAATSTPRVVASVWRHCPDAPILAVLGRPVPGAARLGAVDVPALVGAAALERAGRAPRAAGPAVDGQGRIRFLTDLGPERDPLGADGGARSALERWRGVGIDIRVHGYRSFCPLPTPGPVATGLSVFWATPPYPGGAVLPPIRELAVLLDRSVRDAHPELWHRIVAV